MNMVRVQSSNVHSIGYENGVMRVCFNDGSTYAYFDVPEMVYKEAISANSVGKYLHSHIYGKYKYERIAVIESRKPNKDPSEQAETTLTPTAPEWTDGVPNSPSGKTTQTAISKPLTSYPVSNLTHMHFSTMPTYDEVIKFLLEKTLSEKSKDWVCPKCKTHNLNCRICPSCQYTIEELVEAENHEAEQKRLEEEEREKRRALLKKKEKRDNIILAFLILGPIVLPILLCIFVYITKPPYQPLPKVQEVGVSVYVTYYGEKYHRITCGYLHSSCIEKDLAKAVAAGYEPCSRCHPPRMSEDELTYTYSLISPVPPLGLLVVDFQSTTLQKKLRFSVCQKDQAML